jgi:hypothetical protein
MRKIKGKSKLKNEEKAGKSRSIKKEHCDVCGTPMTVGMYRKYSGFCKVCYKLYFED